MSLSRKEIELLLEELSPALDGGIIQKVFEGTPYHLVLQIRVPGKTHHLLISLEPGQSRLHFVDEKPRQPQHPASFTMLLRKWVQGALVESIDQAPGDRIVTLALSSVDPSWIPDDATTGPAPRVATRLICELTGQTPNAFLVDASGKLLGRLHALAIGDRDLRSGAAYALPAPPPPSDRAEAVRWQLDALPPEERSQTLAQNLVAVPGVPQAELLAQELGRSLRKSIRVLTRRISHIESDLSRIEQAEAYRRYGELLQGAYGQIPRGASAARVPDYYAEGMPEIEIPLDPARSLKDNVERYFHQYRRFKNAREQVEERLLRAMEDLEALEAAQAELEALGDDADALQALQERLKAARLLSRRGSQPQGGKKGAPARRLPYRTFRARSGATILVGRGAKHNDALSTHVARGRDLWLHTRDFAGAHVLVRMDRDDAPKSEDLLDAATLAAYFSKGREDTTIDITYTRAKHVRKPKGFAPGLVTVAGGQTLAIRIDPERLERLLATEESAD